MPATESLGLEAESIVLASASPRRRRLLSWLGVSYACHATDVDESLRLGLNPQEFAEALAQEKALLARQQLSQAEDGRRNPGADVVADRGAVPALPLIVACDTIVVLDDRILGKPSDLEDAIAMLRALSGKSHHVVTGVALLSARESRPFVRAVTTEVRMHVLDDDAISAWISVGELLGCAGAYNIESHLASVGIDECYQNVAGIPLCHIYAWLASGEAGVRPDELLGLTSPVATCDASRCVNCSLGPRLVGR